MKVNQLTLKSVWRTLSERLFTQNYAHRQLKDDKTNLLYAAAYMRIIQSYWQSKGFSIDDRIDIIATIFSYGIFSRSTGEPLKPNADPKLNWFGEQALDIYSRFVLHYPISHE